MHTIVDGKAIAEKIAQRLRDTIRAEGLHPRLDIFVIGDDPVTASFVTAKKHFARQVGVACVEHVFPVTVSTKELCAEIAKIREKTDGMVIQLPLPENIDEHKVLSAIPRDKDVDALGGGATACISPVAGAVIEILQQYDIPLRGANVVVIGRGKLVGVPVSTQLAQRGSRVTVVDSTTSSDEFFGLLQNADIVVAGAGVPGLVVPEMLRQGVVLIDAGTSSSNGTIEGDITLACAEKARIFSKTPGGVGPVTVAVLFRNLVQ